MEKQKVTYDTGTDKPWKPEMTYDTQMALEIIRPFCEELGIPFSANGTVLQIGSTRVGIYMNSTYATIMEALGILFVKEYPRFRRINAGTLKEVKETVSRYWVKTKSQTDDTD